MSNLRVVAFTQLARTYLPTTGVGKFINNVLLRLAAADGVDLTLLLSKSYAGPDGTLPARTPLRNLPFVTYPVGERVMERAWKLAGLPPAGWWVGRPDWLFLPAEAAVPTRRAPTFLVVHDIRYLEPAVPYGDPAEHVRDQRAWRHWFPAATRRAAVIGTVSAFTKNRIVDLLGVDPGKVEVVGNGAEPAFFAAADRDPSEFARPCPEPYLIVVGGLKRSRGALWALDIADKLATRGSPMKIVSAGWDEEVLAADIRRRPNVLSLGRVDDERMVALVRNATAVLFLSTYEGFGIPAVEAMAAGVPAIVSDRTALPEVAADAGLVVDPEKTDAVTDLAERLRTDGGFRAEVIARGRRRAAAFTWDAVAARVLEVMRQRRRGL